VFDLCTLLGNIPVVFSECFGDGLLDSTRHGFKVLVDAANLLLQLGHAEFGGIVGALRRFSYSDMLDLTVFDTIPSVMALTAVAGEAIKELDSCAVVAVLLEVLSLLRSCGNSVAF
jgi:hypothetical protein